MADRIGVVSKGELIVVEEKAALMKKLGKKQLTLHLQAPIKVRLKGVQSVDNGRTKWTAPEGWEPGQPVLLETTLGRCRATIR